MLIFASFYSFIANSADFVVRILAIFRATIGHLLCKLQLMLLFEFLCLFIAIFCGADLNCRLHFILGNAF